MKTDTGIYVSPKYTSQAWTAGRVNESDIIVDRFEGWLFRPRSSCLKACTVRWRHFAAAVVLKPLTAVERRVVRQPFKILQARFKEFAEWLDSSTGASFQSISPGIHQTTCRVGRSSIPRHRTGSFTRPGSDLALLYSLILNRLMVRSRGRALNVWVVCPRLLCDAIEVYPGTWETHRQKPG